MVDDLLRCALWHHHTAEVHRRVVDVIALLHHCRNVRKEGIPLQIEDAEDLNVASRLRAEGIGQVVDAAQHFASDNRPHCARTACVVGDIGQFDTGGLFKLQRGNVVAHKKTGTRECQPARVGLGVVNDIRHGIEFAISIDNENGGVGPPVGDGFKIVGRVRNAAFD